MRVTPLLLALAATACAAPPAHYAVPGTPAMYQRGMQEGCSSGYVAAGHPYYRWTKDVALHAHDNLYKQGWDDGFAKCKGQYEAIGRALQR